jgi:deoxyribose-phosphate aldolase
MTAANKTAAARLLAALDLTSLGEDDTPASIVQLCAAAAEGGHPAAVCVYPEHVTTARRALDAEGAREVAIATVVNFPDGGSDISRALRETRRGLAAGADEIDIVFPWRAYLGGDREAGPLMLQECKAVCGSKVLKAILETGELGDSLLIRELTLAALDSGADFVKTSSGKVKIGATPGAARIMLECIRERGSRAGFKAAGGVRTLADAGRYLALADEILGVGWATPAHFRIGASALLKELRTVMNA